MHRPLSRNFVIPSAWAIFGVYMACQDYVVSLSQGRQGNWERAFIVELTYAAMWALLTPLILHLSSRFPIERTRWGRRVFFHIVVSWFVSLAHKAVFQFVAAVLRAIFMKDPFSWEAQVQNLFVYVDYGILLYWVVLGLDHGLTYYRQYQENALRAAALEGKLARAQLQALKMQLQPHFLFNTLNAISVLVTRDPEKARKTIGWLSELLRFSLEDGAAQEIPLSTELRVLERYLAIEKTRFADRLRIRMTVGRGIRNARVPTLILQPLVENAIRHGVARRRVATRVVIEAQRTDDDLLLSVSNDAPDPPGKGRDIREGVGLSNTRSRLRHLYGDAASISVTADGEGKIIARIRIPFSTEPLYGGGH